MKKMHRTWSNKHLW